VVFEEIFLNQPFVEQVNLDKPQFQHSLEHFFSNLLDDQEFSVLLNIDQQYTKRFIQDPVNGSGQLRPALIPRLQLRPQLNLQRYIRQQHEDWYQEIRQSPFMAGTPGLSRYYAILDKMEAELGEKDPEKIEEYKRYVKDYKEGKINPYTTEE